MKNIMLFEENKVELINLNGEVYFNPYDVAKCLGLADVTVRRAISNMNDKQVRKLTNSVVQTLNNRKLNNRGELFLTESGVYKLAFRSNKPNAEKFTDWVTDEVLPSIRKTGKYLVQAEEDSISQEKCVHIFHVVKENITTIKVLAELYNDCTSLRNMLVPAIDM